MIHDLDSYQWKGIHAQVRDVALDNNFEVLDVLEYYQKYDEHELQVSNGDYTHPSSLGHAVAGEALYDLLKNQNY